MWMIKMSFFKQLANIIPSFDLVNQDNEQINIRNKKIIIEESNACTSEWLLYSLLELVIRAEDSGPASGSSGQMGQGQISSSTAPASTGTKLIFIATQ